MVAPLFLVSDKSVPHHQVTKVSPKSSRSISVFHSDFSVFFFGLMNTLVGQYTTSCSAISTRCDLQQHCVLMPASPGVIVVGQLLFPTYRSLSDGFVYFFPTKAVNASKTLNWEYLIWYLLLDKFYYSFWLMQDCRYFWQTFSTPYEI